MMKKATRLSVIMALIMVVSLLSCFAINAQAAEAGDNALTVSAENAAALDMFSRKDEYQTIIDSLDAAGYVAERHSTNAEPYKNWGDDYEVRSDLYVISWRTTAAFEEVFCAGEGELLTEDHISTYPSFYLPILGKDGGEDCLLGMLSVTYSSSDKAYVIDSLWSADSFSSIWDEDRLAALCETHAGFSPQNAVLLTISWGGHDKRVVLFCGAGNAIYDPADFRQEEEPVMDSLSDFANEWRDYESASQAQGLKYFLGFIVLPLVSLLFTYVVAPLVLLWIVIVVIIVIVRFIRRKRKK